MVLRVRLAIVLGEGRLPLIGIFRGIALVFLLFLGLVIRPGRGHLLKPLVLLPIADVLKHIGVNHGVLGSL